MSDDADDAIEQVHEDIHHHAHGASEKWIAAAAVTTAIFAALAAITASLASHALTRSGRSQIHANDQWAYYQAKSIKKTLLENSPSPDRAKLKKYDDDMANISATARAAEAESELELHQHEVYERGVTFFHIAIPVVAIGILTKRRVFWYGSILFAAVGLYFVVQAHLPHQPQSVGHEQTSTHPES